MIEVLKTVPPDGPRDASIAIVGEAPGEEEMRLRVPFCGRSGQLLNKLLISLQILRRNVYITNVIKEHPFQNDVKPFLDLSLKNPRESARYADYEMYREILIDELKACSANVIVAVGGVPLYALTGKRGITKWRGSILWSDELQRKVIPTIHPAAALRQYIYRYFIQMDLHKVKHQSEFRELKLPKRELILSPSYDDVMMFFEELLRNGTMVATDIEVINEEVDCISFAQTPDRAICVPFAKDYFDPRAEAYIWAKIEEVLTTLPVCGQNIMFDATFLYERYGIIPNIKGDTMVAHAITYPDYPKGLDFMCATYTNEPYYKDDGKKWSKIFVQDDVFHRYNALDSAVIPEILPQLESDIERMGNRKTYDRTIDLMEPLMYMQARGVRIDHARLDQARKDATEKIGTLTDELWSHCGFEINPRSAKQLKEYFYGTLGLPELHRKGSVTVDGKALKRLASKGVKEASIMLQLRKLEKLVGTYYNAQLSSDGRARGSINPVGTDTGRFSSGKNIFGEGLNMQNLPFLYKEFLIPDEGMALYVVDLSQAENRIVAYIAPEPRMQEAFETGADVHARTASYIFDKPESEISKVEGSSTLGNGDQSERFWGKKMNHSGNYKIGPEELAFQLEISINDARWLLKRYLGVYPGIEHYWQWVQDELSKGRTLTNLLGRRRLFLDVWGDQLFKSAYSHIPQSSVADIVNERGIIPLYYGTEFAMVDILNQEHDSIWFQVPLSLPWSKHLEIVTRLKDSLEETLVWKSTTFSIPAEPKTGPNIAHCKPFKLTEKALEARNATSA